MPSGVKKRKAARKKKEKEAKIDKSIDEEFKSQNGSNFGSREVNAVHDRDNSHNPLDGSNGKVVENVYDASPVLSTVDEDESLGTEIQGNNEGVHKFGFDGNGAVEVEKELTSAKNNSCQSISIEYVEGKKYDEKEDENSSCSSGEECSITDKKKNVCNNNPDESSTPTIGINESASVGECTNLLVETTQVPDSVKYEVPVSTEKICPMKVAAGENLVVSETAKSGLKEDANTLLSKQCDGTRVVSLTNPDSLPKENEDKVLSEEMKYHQMSSSMMEQGFKYQEGKQFLSSVSPAVGAIKNDAITKDSEIPICPKKQNSAAAPMVAQRTSIFTCCGLFDLLKGSASD